MRLTFLVIVNLIFCFNVYSSTQEIVYSYKDFDTAKKSESFLKFDMESTKVGIFTTSFEGYVKEIKVSFEIDDNTLAKGVIRFMGQSLDTDNSSRNEKMYNLCLDIKNNSEIIVTIIDKIELGKKSIVNALIKIRGKEHPIKIDITTKKSGNEIFVEGKSKLSLKGLLIPDPSIIVASVNDNINVSFRVIHTVSEK